MTNDAGFDEEVDPWQNETVLTPGVRMTANDSQKPPYELKAVPPKVLPHANSHIPAWNGNGGALVRLVHLSLPSTNPTHQELAETTVEEGHTEHDIRLYPGGGAVSVLLPHCPG